MIASPNPAVAQAAACVGSEKTCAGGLGSLLGGGWLGTTKVGQLFLGLFGVGAEVQSIAEGAPPAGIQTVVVSGVKPIAQGEVVSYQEFVKRSVVGDKIEGHEVWQHANLKANGLATNRLGSAASKQNPVIALSKDTHAAVNTAQRSINAAAQTPAENIAANANVLRALNVAPESTITKIENWALGLAKELGF